MRADLVDLLNGWFHTTLFTYLVPNYLMMLSAAAIAGSVHAARRAVARGLNAEAMYSLAMWSFAAALAGGRLAQWILVPRFRAGGLTSLLDPLQGGMMAYGGLIGGSAAALVYLRRRRLDTWRYLDAAIPAVGVGTFLTRLGCLLNGDDFGSPTNSMLAVTFPAGSPPYIWHTAIGLLPPLAARSLPVHPVQIYLALKGLILAVIAARWSRRPRATPGEAFCLYWLLYGVARFALEFFRGDPGRVFVGPVSMAQVISLAVSTAAGATLVVQRRLK